MKTLVRILYFSIFTYHQNQWLSYLYSCNKVVNKKYYSGFSFVESHLVSHLFIKFIWICSIKSHHKNPFSLFIQTQIVGYKAIFNTRTKAFVWLFSARLGESPNRGGWGGGEGVDGIRGRNRGRPNEEGALTSRGGVRGSRPPKAHRKNPHNFWNPRRQMRKSVEFRSRQGATGKEYCNFCLH
jgi:hypothetical protein